MRKMMHSVALAAALAMPTGVAFADATVNATATLSSQSPITIGSLIDLQFGGLKIPATGDCIYSLSSGNALTTFFANGASASICGQLPATVTTVGSATFNCGISAFTAPLTVTLTYAAAVSPPMGVAFGAPAASAAAFAAGGSATGTVGCSGTNPTGAFNFGGAVKISSGAAAGSVVQVGRITIAANL